MSRVIRAALAIAMPLHSTCRPSREKSNGLQRCSSAPWAPGHAKARNSKTGTFSHLFCHGKPLSGLPHDFLSRKFPFSPSFPSPPARFHLQNHLSPFLGSTPPANQLSPNENQRTLGRTLGISSK